ncbi:MAG TPA: hypothetical protein VGE30_03700 [Candidatus Saccharimonadales bacterium]
MKKLLYTFLATALFAQAMLLAPASVFAWDPFGGVECNGRSGNSAVCKEGNATEDPISGPDGLIINIANFIAIIAGMVAIVIIILAGLRFVQAGGKSEDIAAARRMLIYAVVGIVMIVLARTVVAFVLSTL